MITQAIAGLTGTASDTSQQQCLELQKLANDWGIVNVKWSLGHSGIAGNEVAGKLAKAGAALPELTGQQKPSLAHVRRQARSKATGVIQSWWLETSPKCYKMLS